MTAYVVMQDACDIHAREQALFPTTTLAPALPVANVCNTVHSAHLQRCVLTHTFYSQQEKLVSFHIYTEVHKWNVNLTVNSFWQKLLIRRGKVILSMLSRSKNSSIVFCHIQKVVYKLNNVVVLTRQSGIMSYGHCRVALLWLSKFQPKVVNESHRTAASSPCKKTTYNSWNNTDEWCSGTAPP